MASSVTPTSTTRDCPATEHSGARWIPVPRSRINRFWIEYFNPREALNNSVRGECFSFAPSIHRATRGTGGTTDMTTSHLTNPVKDAGQVIGYSHSTRLPNNSSQVAGYQDERKMYRTTSCFPLLSLCIVEERHSWQRRIHRATSAFQSTGTPETYTTSSAFRRISGCGHRGWVGRLRRSMASGLPKHRKVR